MATKPSGSIITFYSYKGGTGRSMALANMAWVLASNGKRVLVVDWDLEAPGVHRFLHPFLPDKSLSSEGVIDFVVDFAAVAMTPLENPNETLLDDWFKPYANILRYASALNSEFFRAPGTIHFVPAGKLGASYATRVNAFNWQRFYDELGGYWFIEAAKERMKASYDYILIDSRTGVSDTSGICTVQLPDILLVCFTYNNQSIDGAVAVAETVDSQRRQESGEPGIRIFPVPTRVERSEKERLELARDVAREKFAPYLWHLKREHNESYWGQVEVFYEPYYAYEEVLASVADRPTETSSLLASIERLTAFVTVQEVTKSHPLPETERRSILAQYLRQRPVPSPSSSSEPIKEFWFYLSYSRSDLNNYLQQFVKDLTAEIRLRLGVSSEEPVGFFDQASIEVGAEWPRALAEALARSRVLVPLFSPSYFVREYCGKEWSYFLERTRTTTQASPTALSPPIILPVLWVPPRGPLPAAVDTIQYSDLSLGEVYNREGLLYLMRLRRYHDDYQMFIVEFAEKVINAAQHATGVNMSVPSLQQLPNAFVGLREPAREETPAGVGTAVFVFMVTARDEVRATRQQVDSYGETGRFWKPFLPESDRPVVILAQRAASSEGMLYSELPADTGLVHSLRDAEQNNTPVLMIIDLWVLHLERYHRILQEFDRQIFENCAVLVLWNESDSESVQHRASLDEALQATLTSYIWSNSDTFRQGIRSEKEFDATVRQVLTLLRGRIIKRGHIMRPTGTNLAMKAPAILGLRRGPRED